MELIIGICFINRAGVCVLVCSASIGKLTLRLIENYRYSHNQKWITSNCFLYTKLTRKHSALYIMELIIGKWFILIKYIKHRRRHRPQIY